MSRTSRARIYHQMRAPKGHKAAVQAQARSIPPSDWEDQRVRTERMRPSLMRWNP